MECNRLRDEGGEAVRGVGEGSKIGRTPNNEKIQVF
jgi:hypothetical protein